MDPEQIAQELADAGQLLNEASMARLAYNGLDGLPRVVPIGIFWTGDEIVMSTAATAPKVRALSARPEVALTIDAGDSPGSAQTLSVRGVVHLTIVDGVVPEYLAAARKNFDAEYAAEFERNCRAMYATRWRAAVGAVLRLRCRPNAAVPHRTRQEVDLTAPTSSLNDLGGSANRPSSRRRQHLSQFATGALRVECVGRIEGVHTC
jgi:hypothetical protein